MKARHLIVVPGRFSICRLDPLAETPAWIDRGAFHSETRTARELSIVCASDCVPDDVMREEPWSLLEVAGPMDFGQVGVVASLAAPIAAAEVSIFVLSTYDTDYVLVKELALANAIEALREAGHTVEGPTP